MKRKALFIGGTGTISTAITRQLAAEGEWDLTLLNRGNRNEGLPKNVHILKADIDDEVAVRTMLAGTQWDCVCDFIGFVPAQVERDWRLFKGHTRQYMYISSASAYQKPAVNPFITESTPLANPHWQYSRDKIACEEFLLEKFRTEGYPITIVRADMTKRLPFEDGEFDLIFHPVANCYVREVKPIWRECFRVLKPGGVLLAGLDNGINFLFEGEDETRVANALPFNPLKNPAQMEQLQRDDCGVQFSHTLDEQLGGQLRAGFRLTDLYEDTNGSGRLHEMNIPSFVATRAVKP